MDEILKLVNRRLDDHSQQLRELMGKYGDITTAQAVFYEHQNTIQEMYGNIQKSIEDLKKEMEDIDYKVNSIQEKQKDLERIEIRRTELWKTVIQNKVWAVAGICIFVFTSYQIGAWLLNHEPPGKKSIPVELYRKVIE